MSSCHVPDLYTALAMDKTTLDGFVSTLTDGWGQSGSERGESKLSVDFKIQMDYLEGYFKNPKTRVNSAIVALLPLTHLRISLLWSSYVQTFTSQRGIRA